MDIQEFQQRLEQIKNGAKKRGGAVKAEQIREAFADSGLDKKQLAGVLHYLIAQGIRIEGVPEEMPGDTVGEKKDKLKKTTPLTQEEKTCFKGYLAGLPEELKPEERIALFEKLRQGDAGAFKAFSSGYLRKTAELAAEMHSEDIPLADLIQEANICLFEALKKARVQEHDEKWLLKEISKGIERVLKEQSDRKMADDSLVARVEKLDRAVRDLSDDEEDGKSPFSVNELAIILDMDVEEIRDTLRLTGDDK